MNFSTGESDDLYSYKDEVDQSTQNPDFPSYRKIKNAFLAIVWSKAVPLEQEQTSPTNKVQPYPTKTKTKPKNSKQNHLLLREI